MKAVRTANQKIPAFAPLSLATQSDKKVQMIPTRTNQPQLTELETKTCVKNRHRRTQSATVQELNHFRGKVESNQSESNNSGSSQSINRGNFSEDMEKLRLILTSSETQSALEEINRKTGKTIILDDLPSLASENDQINSLLIQKRQNIFKSRDDSTVEPIEKSNSPYTMNIYLEIPNYGPNAPAQNGRSPNTINAKARSISINNELKERILQNPLCNLNMREIQEESLEDVMLTGCSESINQKEMNDVLRCISSHKKSSFHNSGSHLSSLRSSDAGNIAQASMASVSHFGNPSQTTTSTENMQFSLGQGNMRALASSLFSNSEFRGTNCSMPLNQDSKGLHEEAVLSASAKQDLGQARKHVEMYYGDEENKKMVKETLSYFEARSQSNNKSVLAKGDQAAQRTPSEPGQEEHRAKTEGAIAVQKSKQVPSWSPLEGRLSLRSDKEKETTCSSNEASQVNGLGESGTLEKSIGRQQSSSTSSENAFWSQSVGLFQEIFKKFQTMELETFEMKQRLSEVEKENFSLKKTISALQTESSKASKVIKPHFLLISPDNIGCLSQ